MRVDGKVYEIDEVPKLTKSNKHTVDVVVDRLKVREDMRQRLAESFETALRHAEGRAIALEMDSDTEHLFSAKFACPVCAYSLQELEAAPVLVQQPDGRLPEMRRARRHPVLRSEARGGPPDLSLAAGAIRGWDRATSSTSSC